MRLMDTARDALDRFVEDRSRGLREELELAELTSQAGRYRRARERLRGGSLPERVLAHDYYEHYGRDAGEASRCRVRVYADPERSVAPVVLMSDDRGVSVINRVEEIAAKLASKHSLPSETVWISHVPAGRHDPAILGARELYQVVTFPARSGAHFEDLTASEVAWIKTLKNDREE